MKVNLIFGFLGSGKTTLLRRILVERGAEQPLAVIVNEFGDVGIDGAILEGRDVDVVELTSGCLCCTLKGSLLNAIEELHDSAGVQQIAVEATGIAQPAEMIETLSDPTFRTTIDVGPLLTVVNTPKFTVLRKALGEFFTAQIALADVVLLNKIDLAKPEQLESVRQEVRTLNRRASLLFTEQCEVELGLVLDGSTGRFREHSDADENAHTHEHSHVAHPQADSFVIDASGNADRASVEQFFADLTPNVWRAKGFMTIDGQPCLVQFATGQLDITPDSERENPRMVFIGQHLDQTAIEARFACTSRLHSKEAMGELK